MIATVVIVAVFNNSTQLTNAYGFAVATVMFTTTALISLQIRYVKHLPYIFGVFFFLFFGFLDGKVILNHSSLMLNHSRSLLGRFIKEGSSWRMGPSHVRHFAVSLVSSRRRA
jgi:hypothetical protein